MAQVFDIMEKNTSPQFRGYAMGDLLWYPGEPFQMTKQGIVFTPNKVTYTVNPTSDLGKRIAQSSVGIAAHLYYKEFGSADGMALTDVAGGHTEFGMMPLSVAAPMINSGKVKLIALTGTKRPKGFEKADVMNDVLPGVVVNAMWNITLPKNTPKEVVDWYVETFSKAIRSENVKQYFDANYMLAATDLDPVAAKKELDQLRSEYLPISLKLKKEMAK
jgi:tripartite-type tricarboxylate transporter receptor subunit TctC